MTLSDSFATLRPHIDEATASSLAHLLTRAGTSCRSEEFSEAVLASVAGGKRFRALMAHIGYSLAAAIPVEDVALPHLSAALELYQASALVHDDIIDKADERRGMPTPHRSLATHHASHSWIGSSSDFGTHAAILVGDFLFSAATAAADEQALTLDDKRAQTFARRFADMHAEVALGQYLDIAAEQSPLDPERTDALNVSDALEVALHKSAHYSVVHPAVLGAICGAPTLDDGDALSRSLEEILTPWGLAFQLRDDDLGVFGDPAVTGKPAGDDLREGKRTVLLALTWEVSSPAERSALTDVLGVAEASATQISAATRIVASNGRGPHEAEIARLVADGHAALEASTFDDDSRAMLRELCSILTARRA